MIKLACDSCWKALSVRADLAGKKVRCPACNEIITVPSPSDSAVLQASTYDVQADTASEEIPSDPRTSPRRGLPSRSSPAPRRRRGARAESASKSKLPLVLGIVIGAAAIGGGVAISLMPSEGELKSRELQAALARAEKRLRAADVDGTLSVLRDVDKGLDHPVLRMDPGITQKVAALRARSAALQLEAHATRVKGIIADAEKSFADGNVTDAMTLLSDARTQLTLHDILSNDDYRELGVGCESLSRRIAAARATAELDEILAATRKQVADDDTLGAESNLARARSVLTGYETALGPDDAEALRGRIAAMRNELLRKEVENLITSAERSFEGRQLTDAYMRANLAQTRLREAHFEEDVVAAFSARTSPIIDIVEAYRRVESTVNGLANQGEFVKAHTVVEQELAALGDEPREKILRRVVGELDVQLVHREQKAIDMWLAGGGDPSILRVVARRMTETDPLLTLIRAKTDFDKGVIAFERAGAFFTARYIKKARLRAQVVLNGRTYVTTWRRLYHLPGNVFSRAARLGRQLDAANAGSGLAVFLEGVDEIPGTAALLIGQTQQGVKRALFIDGAPWQFAEKKRPDQAAVASALKSSLGKLASAIEQDDESTRSVAQPLAYILRAQDKRSDPRDFLDKGFVYKMLSEGYVKRVLPGIDERAGAAWKEFTDAFAAADTPHATVEARNMAGDTLTRLQTLTGVTYWRKTFMARPDVTVFLAKLPVQGFTSIWVEHEFAGELEDWPTDAKPTLVRMTHAGEGELATYDLAKRKFDANAGAWDRAVTGDDYSMLAAHHRPSVWRIPPHALVLDHRLNTVAIALDSGRLDVPSFPSGEARLKAHDEFVNDVARVLDSPGALGLFFTYFMQYVLDSPVEHVGLLLGSGAFTGEIHQDYHQFLDRSFAGRFLGDCDDLAEFYTVVTRRQNKLSYVLGMPSHATCGWVEDRGAERGDKRYELTYLDTGPPRHFLSDSLDDVLRRGEASYDETGTKPFDPQGIQFLFRFAGEPVRTRYRLGTRMFVDAEYGEVLTRVQEMWHFHTYKEGIDTMVEELKVRPVTSSVLELAALYQVTEQWDEAIELMQRALSQLDAADVSSQTTKLVELAMVQKASGARDAALASNNYAAAKLRELEADPKRAQKFFGNRIACATMYRALDRPAAAWGVLKRDALKMEREGQLPYQVLIPLVNILITFRQLDEQGTLTEKDAAAARAELEDVMTRGFGSGYFESRDSFGIQMLKYGVLASYFSYKFGPEKLIEELSKDGPYPTKDRDHTARGGDAYKDDWPWIRISLMSYSSAIGWMLDKDHPERLKADALGRLVDAGLRALARAERLGAQRKDMTVGWRIIRASLNKDLDELEQVLKEARKKNWSETYKVVSRTLGSSARLVPPDHFRKQVELFAKYVPARSEYFQVAWEAFRADASDHAVIAAGVAANRYPSIKPMQTERDFLIELAKKRAREKQ